MPCELDASPKPGDKGGHMRMVSAGCRARGFRDPNRDHSLFPTGSRPGWCPRLAPFSTPGHAAAQDINRVASSKTTIGTAVPCGPHGIMGRGDRENVEKGGGKGFNTEAQRHGEGERS